MTEVNKRGLVICVSTYPMKASIAITNAKYVFQHFLRVFE